MCVVLYVDVGDNRAILDNLSFSFVSYKVIVTRVAIRWCNLHSHGYFLQAQSYEIFLAMYM